MASARLLLVGVLALACSGSSGDGGSSSGGTAGSSNGGGSAGGVTQGASSGTGGGSGNDSGSGGRHAHGGTTSSGTGGTSQTGARANNAGGSGGVPASSGGATEGGRAGTAGAAPAGGGGSMSGGNAAQGGAVGGSPEPSAFTPFADYVPAGDPITLPGITSASDVAWKPDTDSFFVLLDRVPELYEYGPDFGAPRRVIAIDNGPADVEALAYLGSHAGRDRFALGVEANDNVVLIFELAPDATSVDFDEAVLQTLEPAAAPPIMNKGYEGVAYAPPDGAAQAFLYVCEEGEAGATPIRILRFPYTEDGPSVASYRDGSLTAAEPWDTAAKLGDVAADLSSLYFDVETRTLLVLSEQGSRLLRVEPETGEILDELLLARSPQYEGVTLAGARLVLVSEPNFVEVFTLP